jgi:signal transduction histidine kinase
MSEPGNAKPNQQLRSWLDAMPDPLFLVDPHWRIRHANPAARRLVGGTAMDEAPLLQTVPVLRDTPLGRRLEEAATRGEILRFATRYAGERRHHHFDVTVIPFAGDLLVELRERAVRLPGTDAADSERIARGLVEAGMALASAVSLESVLQILVDVTRELVGARYAAMGVIDDSGSALSEFITSGLTPEHRERIGRLPTGHGILGLLIREPKPIRLRDLTTHAASSGVPSGHPPMKSFLGVPVTAKGRVFGNLYVTEKLDADAFTEQDAALLETLAAQAAIAIENAELRRERDRFFAAASHELGNAVAGVQVWARHLLQRRAAHEDVEQGLRSILKSSEAAHKLIQDLLTLSRAQEGRITLTSWPMDIREVAADAVAELQPDAEASGVRIEVIRAEVRVVIEADPARVRQILLNLLSNATKFTPAGGCVRVGVEAGPDGGAVAWVTDQGPGVAAEDRERIFRPYEQVDHVARGRGIGLGLPLSRKLARLMGGDLWVESEPGNGSTFKLRLPTRMPTTR